MTGCASIMRGNDQQVTINAYDAKSGDIVPANCVFDEWDDDWIEDLISNLSKVNAGKNNSNANHILLILDDCCSDTNFHSSGSFKKLFTRGRHLFISIIITTQYIKHIPPIARSNSDFICVGQLNNQNVEMLDDEGVGPPFLNIDFAK